jgi:hypothetical protein
VYYEIVVGGILAATWSTWFDGLHVEGEVDGATTTISGQVTDQAALHAVLVKIRDLGLPLLAVRRIER